MFSHNEMRNQEFQDRLTKLDEMHKELKESASRLFCYYFVYGLVLGYLFRAAVGTWFGYELW